MPRAGRRFAMAWARIQNGAEVDDLHPGPAGGRAAAIIGLAAGAGQRSKPEHLRPLQGAALMRIGRAGQQDLEEAEGRDEAN